MEPSPTSAPETVLVKALPARAVGDLWDMQAPGRRHAHQP
jgi:hypothetical protein